MRLNPFWRGMLCAFLVAVISGLVAFSWINAASFTAQAQTQTTTIPPAALRTGPADSGATPDTFTLIGVYQGRFVSARIRDGLRVRLVGSEIEISAAPSTAPAGNAQMGLVALVQADGSWMVTAPAGVTLSGPAAVSLNGVRQQEGVDYTRDATNPARFLPAVDTAFQVLSADQLRGMAGYRNTVLVDFPAAR